MSERRTTIEALVRATYLRLAARSMGTTPAKMHPNDQETALSPWHGAIKHDVEAIMAVVDAARQDGIQDAHNAFHRIDSADPEDIDLAVEWAQAKAKEEKENGKTE